MEFSAEKLFKRGVAAHQNGNLKEAEDLYRQVLQTEPRHADANHNLGVLGVSVGKTNAAIPLFMTAISSNPKEAQYWISCLTALLSLQKRKQAIKLIEAAKTADLPTEVIETLLTQLNQCGESALSLENEINKLIDLHNKGFLEDVINIGNKLPKKFKNNHVIQNITGAAYAGLGRYNESLEYYRMAIATYPSYPDVYNNLANSLSYLKQPEMAQYFLKKALILKPFYPEALQNFADILFDQSDYKLSADLLKRLLFKSKPDPELEYKVAHVYKKLCQFEKAISFFDRSKFGDYEAQILECLYQLGKKDDFQKQLYKFRDSNSTDVNIAALSHTVHQLADQKDPYPFCPNPLNYIKIDHLANEIPNWKPLVNDLLISIEKMDLIWEPKFKATIGGEQTDNGLFGHQGHHISILKEVIKKRVVSYFEHFQGSSTLFIRNRPLNIELQGWFVRMSQGGFQQSHIHASGWMSGIVYLKTIDDPFTDQGAIEFGRAAYDFLPDNDNQEVYLYKPKIGDIILFPSSLFRRTIPIESQKERCIISFDVFPTTNAL